MIRGGSLVAIVSLVIAVSVVLSLSIAQVQASLWDAGTAASGATPGQAAARLLSNDASVPGGLEQQPARGRLSLDDDDDDQDGDNDDEEGFVLTILHNNDGESALLPSGDEGGVARFATVVDKARKAALRGPGNDDDDDDDDDDGNSGGVIFVSSGDNFLASPAFSASIANGTFYDAVALDLLGYDAIDLGNHDFDFGPNALAEFINDFRKPGRPPYLSSNLDFSGDPALQQLFEMGVIAESIIVRERGEKVGIIGATTPDLPFISSPRNVVVLDNVAAEVQAEIDKLVGNKVNKIVLISHLQGINEDIALAQQLTGVDVMVAGGGDELLANAGDPLLPSDQTPGAVFGPYPLIAVDAAGNDVPVVTTSGQYGYLGRLVVEFDKHGKVMSAAGGPIRVVDPAVGPDGVKSDRQMQEKVVAPVDEFVADLANNIIATSEVALDGRRSSVRTIEANQGNLIADALKWQAEQLAASFGVPVPEVALQNGGGIRNDAIIPAGKITELDTFNMVPFANFVAVVPNIPRTQFKEILENAVSRVEFTDGRFAQISGFSFTYAASGTAQVLNPDGTVATPGTRVTEATLDSGVPIVIGGAVQPGPDLTIATIDFLARGGDQYPYRGAAFTTLGVSYQQALFNYIGSPAGLDGLISAADYPEGGEGRITRLP